MRLLNRYHIPISVMAGLLFVTCLLAVTGCAGGANPRLPEPSALSAPGGQDMDGLTEGRMLYLAECASCHKRIWPDEKTPEEWMPILGRHEVRLSVSAVGFANILEYILRASGRHLDR